MGLAKDKLIGILTMVPLVGYGSLFLGIKYLSIEVFTDYLQEYLLIKLLVTLLIAVTAVSGLGLMVFYINHAIRAPYFSSTIRAAWIVTIVLFNMFSMPIYFFRYVWSNAGENEKRT